MKIRIGTRRSPLALWQAHHVSALLKANDATLEVELMEIVTKGDKILDAPLAMVGGKGLFVKEIEEQLLSREIDLAVHSLKDMPSVLPEGLVLGAIPLREDPRDALVSRRFRSLDELPKGARVGTSSLRRACQLKTARRDLEIVSIRGNVQTRLRKIDEELDAGVLAAAGLKRLELQERITQLLTPRQCLPAVGQGALALEVRSDDAAILKRVSALEHAETRLAVSCERAFLRGLGGGCQVPIAAHATLDGAMLDFRGLVGHPDGSRVVEFSERVKVTTLAEAELLGAKGAGFVLARGAAKILAEVLAPSGLPES